eukprot:Skav206358  [mRNA]  locus=scaffold3448:230697:241751:- [translate_table: standard]
MYRHGTGAVEHCLENFFEKVGKVVGKHPVPWLHVQTVKTLVASLVFTVACGGGFAFLSSETRPEKQWVPAGAAESARGGTGSLALDHDAYVKQTWPGNARFNFFSATCNDVSESDCNILDPKYIQAFHRINEKVKAIKIDGTKIVKDLDEAHKISAGDNRPWTIYEGNWSFGGTPMSVNGSVQWDGRMCFTFGPFCAKSSILDVFREDDYVIENLNANEVKLAINNWEEPLWRPGRRALGAAAARGFLMLLLSLLVEQ